MKKDKNVFFMSDPNFAENFSKALGGADMALKYRLTEGVVSELPSVGVAIANIDIDNFQGSITCQANTEAEAVALREWVMFRCTEAVVITKEKK